MSLQLLLLMELIMRPHIINLFLFLLLLLLLPVPGHSHLQQQKANIPPTSIYRKLLDAIDSSHHHHPRRHHSHQSHHQGHNKPPLTVTFEPNPTASHVDDDSEIDPRYGVEKRFVPCGPNPLHH
ncbi:CLAVATA3/ESR (CLE)-related protein 13 [Dendrobium catenatum]|uniref:CLAVATA3/ESR (CLE)-related protein 13 n=1 Tax=Dendrobium catenatum TaxID=906689 RepID=A0A2I0XDG8_9ASPA|nr:CLAVATA3/ESR (CLE)-related protein 13 [Dendrobium catenatum]